MPKPFCLFYSLERTDNRLETQIPPRFLYSEKAVCKREKKDAFFLCRQAAVALFLHSACQLLYSSFCFPPLAPFFPRMASFLLFTKQ